MIEGVLEVRKINNTTFAYKDRKPWGLYMKVGGRWLRVGAGAYEAARWATQEEGIEACGKVSRAIAEAWGLC